MFCKITRRIFFASLAGLLPFAWFESRERRDARLEHKKLTSRLFTIGEWHDLTITNGRKFDGTNDYCLVQTTENTNGFSLVLKLRAPSPELQ